jgi:hypothetical protein
LGHLLWPGMAQVGWKPCICTAAREADERGQAAASSGAHTSPQRSADPPPARLHGHGIPDSAAGTRGREEETAAEGHPGQPSCPDRASCPACANKPAGSSSPSKETATDSRTATWAGSRPRSRKINETGGGSKFSCRQRVKIRMPLTQTTLTRGSRSPSVSH